MHPDTLPDDDTLLAYTLGELSPLHRSVIDAHLVLRPDTAGKVETLAAPGGTWLRQQPTRAPAPDLFAKITAQLPDADPYVDLPLPAALRSALPRRSSPPRFGRLPGSRVDTTVLARDGADSLVLVTLPPDTRLPNHRHLGLEALTVLTSGYEDHLGETWTGDYRTYPPGSAHDPVNIGDEAGWILAYLQAGVRFTGWRGVVISIVEKLRARKRAVAQVG
ncbi:MAG: cupin domain-containing protein [Acidobacteriota bacterium]